MMMSNIKNILSMYSQFRANPMAMLSRAYNIPNEINTNDPNKIIQHLLDSGQVTQAQVNSIMGMKNDPTIKQFWSK